MADIHTRTLLLVEMVTRSTRLRTQYEANRGDAAHSDKEGARPVLGFPLLTTGEPHCALSKVAYP